MGHWDSNTEKRAIHRKVHRAFDRLRNTYGENMSAARRHARGHATDAEYEEIERIREKRRQSMRQLGGIVNFILLTGLIGLVLLLFNFAAGLF